MTAGPVPFLKQLAEPDAEALLGLVRRKCFPRAAVIMSEGSAGDDVMLVLSGRAKVLAAGVEQREVALALRGPGELIGEMSALGHSRRTATAIAAEDVELGIVSSEQFHEFLRAHPDAALVLIRSLVRRLTEATRALVDLATQDSVGRIARRLVELAADDGAKGRLSGPIELELTQDELASWTGTTRETVSRALRLMRQLGWVSTGHRTITVLEPAALRERGGERSG